MPFQSDPQDFIELLARLQNSRLDDQRCVLPAYFSGVVSTRGTRHVSNGALLPVSATPELSAKYISCVAIYRARSPPPCLSAVSAPPVRSHGNGVTLAVPTHSRSRLLPVSRRRLKLASPDGHVEVCRAGWRSAARREWFSGSGADLSICADLRTADLSAVSR